jgi:hypothetical protein
MFFFGIAIGIGIGIEYVSISLMIDTDTDTDTDDVIQGSASLRVTTLNIYPQNSLGLVRRCPHSPTASASACLR